MQAVSEKFWKLLEPIHSKAEGFCRRLAGNRDDGDDLYQEAILAALAKFGTLRDESAFKAWFYRIVVNGHKNHRRLPWWRRVIEQIGQGDNDIGDHQSHDPSEKYAARRYLEIALSALKSNERALIVLYELEGWPVADLAELFGSPDGTIKARLSRARQKMRKALIPLVPQDEKNKRREDGYELPESSATAE